VKNRHTTRLVAEIAMMTEKTTGIREAMTFSHRVHLTEAVYQSHRDILEVWKSVVVTGLVS
jgi:hypothetical protein